MKNLNILHISDVHVQKKDEREIREISQKLIADMIKVQEEKAISIDLVCFTGDLIQQGNLAVQEENQWELAMDILIKPLMQVLKLSMDKFIFVPGNHEVDTKKIMPALEAGLQKKGLQEINDIYNEFYDDYKSRLSYFYEMVKTQQTDVEFGKLGYAYKKQINGLNIGIACMDSAWRSSGKGRVERGKVYLCPGQVKELFCIIGNCDIKICMMHHPVNWLEESECNEVEKELAKFDIVLNGHVHEENLKQVLRSNLKTVYSTAGKLYPLDYAYGRAVDGYNGYSILNIDYERGKCTVYVRSYFAQNRNEFDTGLNICSNGEETYDVCTRDDNWQLEYDIIKGINNYFCNMSEKYSLIKEIDTQSPQNLLQTLVEPVLSLKSEYVKENTDEEKNCEISIQKIFESNDNTFLIGKKESGKTTILQQIGIKYIEMYESREVIPIHINMKYLPKGSDRIYNYAVQFLVENILDGTSISKQAIKRIFEEGKVVFLIDNVKIDNADHTIWINKFINEYSENRFILTIEEEFFQSLDIKEIPEYGQDFKKIYIQYMGKTQIRSMVTQWARGKENVNIDETVNRIDSYCNQINFAKTPFNITIFMVLWDNDNNFIPINEGIVMENYLEIVLEKMSPKESYRNTYSFKIKQNFLSYLAYCMYLKNEYFFKYDEFMQIAEEYHRKKGYNLKESKFDVIFFDKNILSYSREYIVFSHTSFLEYFLAIYAMENKKFLSEITSEGKRTFFGNEICFYAGLNQNCKELLEQLSDTILDTVVEFLDLVEELNAMEIMTEFRIDRDKLIEDIKKNRPTQEEIDYISDKLQKRDEKKPTEINKRDVEEDVAENFFSLLQMYGSVIKNAELLDNKDKIMHLEYYMYGMNMLYAMLIKLFEYAKEEMTFETLSDSTKDLWKGHTKEEFEKAKTEMVEMSKLMFPIAIQNVILENVGTPKLEAAINELIKAKRDKPFEKFMLTFLKCDLKIVNLKSELSQYIKDERSEGILKRILIKLTFYYKMRFFGSNVRIDKDLIDLITEIHVKLNPKTKSHYIPKSLVAKEIEKQLNR